jgi:hypothetical protein
LARANYITPGSGESVGFVRIEERIVPPLDCGIDKCREALEISFKAPEPAARLKIKGSFGGYIMRLILPFFVIVILAGAVLTACNSAEMRRAATPGQSPTPSDGVRRITVAELKTMMDNNEAFVIDVRNEASYDAGHIKGSKLIPEADILKHLDELPRDKTIVTYCS